MTNQETRKHVSVQTSRFVFPAIAGIATVAGWSLLAGGTNPAATSSATLAPSLTTVSGTNNGNVDLNGLRYVADAPQAKVAVSQPGVSALPPAVSQPAVSALPPAVSQPKVSVAQPPVTAQRPVARTRSSR